jgi:hypothetical protein
MRVLFTLLLFIIAPVLVHGQTDELKSFSGLKIGGTTNEVKQTIHQNGSDTTIRPEAGYSVCPENQNDRYTMTSLNTYWNVLESSNRMYARLRFYNDHLFMGILISDEYEPGIVAALYQRLLKRLVASYGQPHNDGLKEKLTNEWVFRNGRISLDYFLGGVRIIFTGGSPCMAWRLDE